LLHCRCTCLLTLGVRACHRRSAGVPDRTRAAKAAASLQELGTPLLEVFLAQDEAGQLRAQPVSLRPPSMADDIRSGTRCAAPGPP
jgi:hypothetical protein